MKISTRGRYGLIALVDIAACDDEKCTTIKNIAERQGISEHYLEQLIAPLKKAGIVMSIRGAQGGYRLNRDAADISVGEALSILEGSLYPVDCISASPEPDTCCGTVKCGNCVTKSVWEKLYTKLSDVLNSISLADLVSDYREKNL